MTNPTDPRYWDHPDDRNDPWPPPERSTTMTSPSQSAAPSDEHLDAEITADLFEDFFDSPTGRWRYGGHVYELADEVQLASLGEDPDADDVPLVLVRQGDGAMFEVDLWATVRCVTPEQADRDRRELMALREAAAARQESAGGAA
jgi:hypothetical protein